MPISVALPGARGSAALCDEDCNASIFQDVADNHTECPPDGGYGWICVACCFAVNCFTWGVVSSFGVFLSYYLSSNIFLGSRPLDYALIGGLNFGAAMLTAPYVTVACRNWGLRVPMYAGTLFLGGGFIAASYATHTWHLYLSQGALVGIGVGFVYIPTIPVLSQWFDKRRSLAHGIATAGSGIGGLIFSLATGAMINNLGRGWALRIIGIIVLVTNTLSTSFLRDRSAIVRPQQHPFDLALLMRWDVFFLLVWAFISMLGYITLLYSFSDFARSIGLSAEQATQVTALLNLGTALGRPFIGIASDRYGRFEVASGLTMLCGLCCLAIWIPTSSFGVTVLFGMISGAILGVFWVVSGKRKGSPDLTLMHQTVGPLCVEVTGLKQQPSLLALSWLSIVLPTTCNMQPILAF
ncbi:hypothetical protein LTR64_008778 [Lithohypha guttulata]|uniref:uncharacterized protein n=1 Tax=Lithohypha guttulata TaxID=1690604 RepID=UPI00315D21B9